VQRLQSFPQESYPSGGVILSGAAFQAERRTSRVPGRSLHESYVLFFAFRFLDKGEIHDFLAP